MKQSRAPSSVPLCTESDLTFSPSLWITHPCCCLIPFPLLFLLQLYSTRGTSRKWIHSDHAAKHLADLGRICVFANADSRTLVCIRELTESAGGIPVMTLQPSHPGRSDSGVISGLSGMSDERQPPGRSLLWINEIYISSAARGPPSESAKGGLRCMHALCSASAEASGRLCLSVFIYRPQVCKEHFLLWCCHYSSFFVLRAGLDCTLLKALSWFAALSFWKCECLSLLESSPSSFSSFFSQTVPRTTYQRSGAGTSSFCPFQSVWGLMATLLGQAILWLNIEFQWPIRWVWVCLEHGYRQTEIPLRHLVSLQTSLRQWQFPRQTWGQILEGGQILCRHRQ